jgi:HPt (histidine-containing phosphotransfer) domain-containing protein
MTDEELRSLVASLAIATAKNTENIDRNTQTIDRNAQAIDRNAQAIDSLAQRFEDIRENMTYNTQAVADGLELAAAANRTAAAAMELSANTSRNLDRLEQDIAELKQIVGIVIQDNNADRSRITRLEEQE